MKSASEVERIQVAIRRMDAFFGPAVLFDRGEKIVHANEKARSLFARPLLTRHDLPEQLTVDLDDALAKGRWSVFCFQATEGPLFRNRIYPEYFDLTQPKNPTFACLWMEEEAAAAVSESISRYLYFELRGGAVPLATHLRLREEHQSDPEYLAKLERAGGYLVRNVIRVTNILASVLGASSHASLARETVALASLVAEAYQRQQSYHGEVTPLQLICKGPDDLAFSTSRRSILTTIFTEILLDGYNPSNSVTVQWAEDHERLGVPTAKVEFSIEGVKDGVGFGLKVAEEFTLDMHGRMEFTPGMPGPLSLWLPLTPP